MRGRNGCRRKHIICLVTAATIQAVSYMHMYLHGLCGVWHCRVAYGWQMRGHGSEQRLAQPHHLSQLSYGMQSAPYEAVFISIHPVQTYCVPAFGLVCPFGSRVSSIPLLHLRVFRVPGGLLPVARVNRKG